MKILDAAFIASNLPMFSTMWCAITNSEAKVKLDLPDAVH
jgi:hypothetical protein